MAFNIEQFKSELTRGGARPSLFEVTIQTPPAQRPQIPESVKFFVEAAQIPASNLGLIQVPYFGRIVKLAGDRQFEPWTVTVLNDETFNVRNALEGWSSLINNLQNNIRDTVYSQEKDYKSTAFVTQYGKNGDKLRTYKFEGLFPQAIGAIDLSWEALDQLERFQVTFEYDYYTLENVGNVDPNLFGDL